MSEHVKRPAVKAGDAPKGTDNKAAAKGIKPAAAPAPEEAPAPQPKPAKKKNAKD